MCRKALIINLFILMNITLFCFDSNKVFANTYDISQINNAKSLSSYNNPTNLSLLDEMDTVLFGRYPQSDTTGYSYEPIEWIVLYEYQNSDGSKGKTLLSKYILDCRRWNSNGWNGSSKHLYSTGNDWKNCSLRKWLNIDFLNDAFTSEEQEIMDSPVNGYDDDKVSLMDKSFFDYTALKNKQYIGTREDSLLRAKPTNFAKITETYEYKGDTYPKKFLIDYNTGYASYWLVDQDKNDAYADEITHTGGLSTSSLTTDYSGIRPLISIKIK